MQILKDHKCFVVDIIKICVVLRKMCFWEQHERVFARFRMSAMDTSEKLKALRTQMQQRSLYAYVVPSEDAHQSEYIAACDKRRAFISGFTGSAGLAIVTLDQALLFTDGRYHLQAEKQFDSNWILMRSGLADVPTWQEWLISTLSKDQAVGIDPLLIPACKNILFCHF